jgi:hypothetical protein
MSESGMKCLAVTMQKTAAIVARAFCPPPAINESEQETRFIGR